MRLDDAVAKLRAGEPHAALPLFEALLQEDDSSVQLWCLTGACRFELRALPSALEAFDRALRLVPAHAGALYGSALVLEELGRPDEALARYEKTLAADPQHADAHHNRGLLLAKLGRLHEALLSHQAYAAAHPGSARAHADLADVLLAQDRYAEALESAKRAIEIGPQSMHGALVAGLACAMLEQFTDSQAWLQRARAMDPVRFNRLIAERLAGGSIEREMDPRAIRLLIGFKRLESCEWRDYAHYVALFDRLIASGIRDGKPLASPPLAFRSLAVPMALERRRQLADGVARHLSAAVRPWRQSATRGARIRLGYVSPDFRTHPIGILSAPLFSLHDRSRFEVHAFSLSPDDGSEWRRRVEKDADHFHQLHGQPFLEVQRRVRDAAIDVLVDLAGYTTGALPELFAERAAPIQVSYLGFPGSSGAGFVDYLLCDEICVPPAEESAYAESLVRLPATFWICEPGEIPQSGVSRRDLGLPDDGFVFYAHHPGQKITPAIFTVWMDVLKAVPDAVLWLLDDRPGMATNLRREAQHRGVVPHRLVFAPRVSHDKYRARIALADLALDTPAYNGGATTLDALGCGVPVLTCTGSGFAGRMAASALKAAGFDELVVADLRNYADTATSLAREPLVLASLKRRVLSARKNSKLFDVPARVRELEAAYLAMISRHASYRR